MEKGRGGSGAEVSVASGFFLHSLNNAPCGKSVPLSNTKMYSMKALFFFLGLALLVSCGGRNSDVEATADDTLSGFSWEATMNDTSGKLELVKKEAMGPDTLSAAGVIAFLNAENPNVQLQFQRVSGDTLFVSIPDAHYLTQQMGSTGPQLYFAESVYNLTEVPGIRFVHFDFEEGDHASPATLNREQFTGEGADL